jgi:hypothetical protein
MAYSEVVRTVFEGQDATNISHRILGPHPPRPESLPEILPESPAPSPAGDAHASARPPRQAWFPHAAALPAPRGTVLRVDSATALIEAAAQVPAGGTIMIAPGVYKMPQSLLLNTDDVSLRGASGQRGDVVLDFGDSRHHEAIRISACSGVTVADLTIANVRQNGLKINSDTGARRVTIHNLVGHNIWQRHVKGVKSPDREGQPTFVDDCRIQYCLFYNDRPKRRGDDPWEDAHPRMRFNYVGGIDVMSARNWQIRDNVFLNINGQTGEARGAIFLWQNSQGCRVERNVIVDCDSGICLGNSSDRGPRRHAVGCLVQNNFVTRCSESNLLADHTRDCQFLHNTVHDPQSRNGRLLRVVHANDGLLIAGNLFSGPRIVIEQLEGALERRDNLIRPVGEFFVDPEAGDLHLTRRAAAAIDAGRGLKQLSEDIDRQPRDRRPDLGADEWRPAKETADR